ncbi:uncharacterized protein LOC119122003 [Syngnathus acus]|uniref:uncharacterized protein LOC119122003 n=1 Tax=Syngnathus acus TaxID=161584 RepID=UPI0018862A46|nr:uncharacterized protein LOC119122003 [Syngnathus acus]
MGSRIRQNPERAFIVFFGASCPIARDEVIQDRGQWLYILYMLLNVKQCHLSQTTARNGWCLRATPVNQQPVLAGIDPANIRREAATLALSRKAQTSESHLLHKIVTETPRRVRVKSRHPFAIQAHELLSTTLADTSKATWIKTKWREQWKSAEPSRLHHYINDPTDVSGQDLPLNRLRTGVGCCGAAMKRWGLADSASCECGDPVQTVEHMISSCPKHQPPNGEQGLIDLDDDTLTWLASTELQV